MHALEAVLGVLLSIPDPHLQEIIRTLNQDELFDTIITKVVSSPFGPHAIQDSAQKYPNSVSSEYDDFIYGLDLNLCTRPYSIKTDKCMAKGSACTLRPEFQGEVCTA